MPAEPPRHGRVVALQANFCAVELDQPGPGDRRRLLCTRRTRLGKSGQQICVGDRVGVDGIDWPSGRGAVVSLEPRSSLLQRPAVANVSRVVVVASLAEPALDPLQLCRFLATAETTGQPVLAVFSKADLLADAEVEQWCRRLAGWGYEARAISTASGRGLEELRLSLAAAAGIAVLCGPSGVGKSSLLNALCPELGLRVATVSGRLQRGRHTTRHVELFPLAGSQPERAGTAAVLLADTPGFNRPELPPDPAALPALFPELQLLLSSGPCRFRNCRHQGDPGCAAGHDWDRFELYGQCLREVEEAAAAGQSRGRARSAAGDLRRRGDRLEPLLDPRWRRPSRRSSRQQESADAELSPPDPAG